MTPRITSITPTRPRPALTATEIAPASGPQNPAALHGAGLFAVIKRTFKQFGQDKLTDWGGRADAKWPVPVILVSLTFAVLYWASPNAKTGGLRWVSPGGVFASYNKTYGTLGGVIAFPVWIWISNIAILLGAELDAEMERGRAAAGHDPHDEPYLQLRDDRKLDGGDRHRE